MKELMNSIRLIHPIYLDVPMLVSFAAAIQGGVAYESDVSREDGKDKGSLGKVKGKLGFNALFASLFDANLETLVQGHSNDMQRATIRESRSHTEASIAILLYDSLCKGENFISHPKTLSDFNAIAPGSLVELTGRIEKNAVDSVIDWIDAVTILSELQMNGKPADQKNLKKIRDVLERDRKRTPLSNVLLRCPHPNNLTAIATLRRDNLRDLTLSELHNNTARVLGKVTRIVPEGQAISSFENYGLSLLMPEMLTQLFNAISETDGIKVEFSDVQVRGPAVQVLPLMIFV